MDVFYNSSLLCNLKYRGTLNHFASYVHKLANYYFVDAKNEEEYNEFVKNAKDASLYDTGKIAKYGDRLITLSTCSYHTEDGRFVVVAREKDKN